MPKVCKTTRADGVLERLAEKIRAIENRPVSNPRLPLGAIACESSFGTDLMPGAIHEWFGTADPNRPWTPPLCLLAHLAHQASARAQAAGRVGKVLWLGRCVWPYMWMFQGAGVRGPESGVRSPGFGVRGPGSEVRGQLFADPVDASGRLWAIDLALRSGAVAAVVADGSGLDMTATRRLQLAAEAGQSIGLLARPPDELGQLSAAATRWQVSALRSETTRPRWKVKLLRWKGASANCQASTGNNFMVEWNGATGAVFIPADMVSRSGQEQVTATRRRRIA